MHENPQFIQMIQTLGTPFGTYRRDMLYQANPPHTDEWIAKGFAKLSADKPRYVLDLLARLDDGAGRPCIFAPPVGAEFGHLILTHIRLVHFHRASEKIVCCRPGEEVLYPSATKCITDWTDPVIDKNRVGSPRDVKPDAVPEWTSIRAAYPDHHVVSYSGLTMDQELWCIEPMQRIPFQPKLRGLRADVLFGVRQRALCPEKNWQYWGMMAGAARAAGVTFAVVGARGTSYDLPGQLLHTGDYDTDAAIELMQNCKLYIGSDTGSAHLAATVGCPMLVVRQRSRVTYRDFVARMEQVNPQSTELVDRGWENPGRVIQRMLEICDVSERKTA